MPPASDHTHHDHDHDHEGHDHAGHDHGHSHAHGHGHSHGHGGHGHSHAPKDFGRAFAIGAGLNLAFVAGEAVVGVVTGSLSLLADAGHNLSDVASLGLAWVAAVMAKRIPTIRRSYGLRKGTILASLFNATLLMAVIGAVAWEAIRRFGEPPHTLPTGWVALTAGIGIAVNAGSALLFMSGGAGDLNVRGAFLHLAGDAAVSAGVVAAAFGMSLTGWWWLDPTVSLIIVAIILVSSWGLLRESLDLALDATPQGIDPGAVQAWLGALPGVTEVHDLHIWALSTTETALTAHLVRPQTDGHDAFLHQTCAGLIRQFGIGHATLQLEQGGGGVCRLAPADVV